MKQFLQENLFIVITVAVAVTALGCVFIPISNLEAQQQSADQLENQNRELTSAIANAVSPKWVAQSDANIAQIKQAQEEVIEKALLHGWRQPLLRIANGRKELVFPSPSQVDAFSFGGTYDNSMALWRAQLKAELIPQTETGAAVKVEGGANPQDLAFKMHRLADAGCRIWVSEASFDIYPTRSGQAMSDREMWEAQVNWWVQSDIVAALAQVNSEPLRTAPGKPAGLVPQNVRETPVKELVWIDVDEPYFGLVSGAASGSNAAAPATLTGHVTCSQYDVVQYRMQVIMNVDKLPQLVGALSRRNFHTLLSVRYDLPQDKGRKSATGAVRAAARPENEQLPEYGPNPVMAVTMDWEAVFMKSPLSWRDATSEPSREAGRLKRLNFLKKHPQLVLEVHELVGGREQPMKGFTCQDIQANPAAKQKELIALLADPKALKDVTFVALYEDLMPGVVKKGLPGFGAPAGTNR